MSGHGGDRLPKGTLRPLPRTSENKYDQTITEIRSALAQMPTEE